MNQDNLAKAERNEFNKSLNDYQKQEMENDLRNFRIEEQVNHMTSEGEEYYPFTPDNLSEALTQMSLADSTLLGSYAHVAMKIGTDCTKVALTDFILRTSKKYWNEVARLIIERDKLID